MNPADWSVGDWMIVLFLFSVVAVPLILQTLHKYRVGRREQMRIWQRRAMMDEKQVGFDVIPTSAPGTGKRGTEAKPTARNRSVQVPTSED